MRAERDPLAILNHELRTPLNAIIGFAEMLDREVLGQVGNQRYRDYARHIMESGTHLRDVIAGLLTMLSGHDGPVAPKVTPIDPAAVMRDGLARVRADADAAGVHLASRACGSGDIRLLVDPEALAKILAALAEDAILFARRGDRVSLSCRPAAGRQGLVFLMKSRVAIAPPTATDTGGGGDRGKPTICRDLGPAVWHWLVRLNGGRLDLMRQTGAPWKARIGFPQSLLRRRGTVPDLPGEEAPT